LHEMPAGQCAMRHVAATWHAFLKISIATTHDGVAVAERRNEGLMPLFQLAPDPRVLLCIWQIGFGRHQSWKCARTGLVAAARKGCFIGNTFATAEFLEGASFHDPGNREPRTESGERSPGLEGERYVLVTGGQKAVRDENTVETLVE